MDNTGKWALVSLKDSLIFEGLVESETPYGIYLCIGGEPGRLSLFPWHSVVRVTYKN
jgi:hypothetical protein